MTGITMMSIAMSLIVLAAMFSSLPAAHADAGFISRTCTKTKNAAMCAAVLRVDPKSANVSTEHDLASIALKIAINTAKDNGEFINDLAKKSHGTPEGDALNVCLGAYLPTAMELDIEGRTIRFDGGDYAGTSKILSGAKRAGDICENAFKGIRKMPAMTVIDTLMTELCGVAGDLVDLLIPK